MDSTQDATKAQPNRKRAYTKPVVTDFGNVRELTRGTSTKSSDYHATTRQNA